MELEDGILLKKFRFTKLERCEKYISRLARKVFYKKYALKLEIMYWQNTTDVYNEYKRLMEIVKKDLNLNSVKISYMS